MLAAPCCSRCQWRAGHYEACCAEGKPGHRRGIRTVNLSFLATPPHPSVLHSEEHTFQMQCDYEYFCPQYCNINMTKMKENKTQVLINVALRDANAAFLVHVDQDVVMTTGRHVLCSGARQAAWVARLGSSGLNGEACGLCLLAEASSWRLWASGTLVGSERRSLTG